MKGFLAESDWSGVAMSALLAAFLAILAQWIGREVILVICLAILIALVPYFWRRSRRFTVWLFVCLSLPAAGIYAQRWDLRAPLLGWLLWIAVMVALVALRRSRIDSGNQKSCP